MPISAGFVNLVPKETGVETGTKPEEKSWGCTLPRFCDQKKKGPHFFWFKKASVSFIFFDFHVFFAEYLGAKGNKTPDLVGGKVKIVWERGGQQFLWGCTFLIWGCTFLIWGCQAPLCTPLASCLKLLSNW